MANESSQGVLPSDLPGGVLALAVLVAVGLAALVTGVVAGPVAAAPVLGTGAFLVLIGRVGVRGRRRLGLLGLQLVATAGAAVTVGALATWTLITVQVDMGTDALVIAALLAVVALGVVHAIHAVAYAVAADLENVCRGLVAVGEGDRDVRLTTTGADETARVAEAGNRMIEQIARREAERDEAQATRESLVRAMVDRYSARETERAAAEVMRRQLVLGVSHDVRTPLTALRLLTTEVRDELVDQDELAEHADSMLRQLDLLGRLTEQVFELARLEAGDVGWARTPTQVGELIREAVEHLRPAAAARDVRLLVEAAEGLPATPVAPDRILRVVVNLVQNALQHTPAGGRVRVSVREAGGCVTTEVDDTGSGIAPEDRASVFEPFFRGDGTSVTSGTGLGLAISRAIVEAHGGRIELVAARVGTRVRFTLPVDAQPRARSEA